MNIIERLTAVTGLAVCIGVLTPTTIALAKTSSTNDSHTMKTESTESAAVGFAVKVPQKQSGGKDINNTLNTLRKGDKSPSIAKLQEELKQLGYYHGEINGVFGDLTLKAIDSFQADQKLSGSGEANTETTALLYNIYYHQSQLKAAQAKAAEITQQEKAAAEAKARQAAAQQQAQSKQAAAPVAQAAPQPQKAAVQSVSYTPGAAARQAPKPAGNTLTVLATGYALKGLTATGTNVGGNSGAKVIAVDPSVIPLGSRVVIPGYGTYIAADTGGSIRGNRIDVHFPTKAAALAFGQRTLTITVIH
ncbi:3D domain-containing protein [Sporolactobacillus sp. KGMB 08714]|uniref:3D domain-containing protein n=1 Tax=Sporolactobacillus sp. KGMB 08714 TaxID=3064704 RepID=UPI002FBEF63F